MSTHLPVRLYTPLQRQRQRLGHVPTVRFFSATPMALGRGPPGNRMRRRADPVIAATAARYQPGTASSVLQQRQINDERNIPDDVGLIPGTFVHAPLMPLTRFSIKQRFQYEWKWIKSRAAAWFQLWRFRRSFAPNKPHVYWFSDRNQLKNKAVQKYLHLYESFARADSAAIDKLCVSGVASKFKERISSRPSTLRMQWKAVGEPTCTIMSNIASPLSLPGYEETGIHQVVFRIRSEQKIKLLDRDGHGDNASQSSPDGKVEEYLVMQRQWIRGAPKDWTIWGFTEFSTPSSIQESEEYARKVNAFQAA